MKAFLSRPIFAIIFDDDDVRQNHLRNAVWGCVVITDDHYMAERKCQELKCRRSLIWRGRADHHVVASFERCLRG